MFRTIKDFLREELRSLQTPARVAISLLEQLDRKNKEKELFCTRKFVRFFSDDVTIKEIIELASPEIN